MFNYIMFKYIILYHIILYYIICYNIILNCIILYYVYYIILYYVILYYSMLYDTILCYNMYITTYLNCLIIFISFHTKETPYIQDFFVDPPYLSILTAGSCRSTDLFLWNPAGATCISTTESASDAAAAGSPNTSQKTKAFLSVFHWGW